MKKQVWKKAGNTWYGNPGIQSDYKNICLFATKELHDYFMNNYAAELHIGEIITDKAEIMEFCKQYKYNLKVDIYSIITHK